MSKSKLPQRASLEYLKKLAKDQLKEQRRKDPTAKLAAAQPRNPAADYMNGAEQDLRQ